MDLLTFEGFSGFPLGQSTVSLGIPSSNSFLHIYYYYCVWVKPRSRAIFSNKRSSKILTPWVHQHPLWYRWKIPKIHLNYFSLLQIFRAQTKSRSLSSNLTIFWDFIRPLRGLAQKGKGTNVGAGSLWPNSKPHFDNVPTLGLFTWQSRRE